MVAHMENKEYLMIYENVVSNLVIWNGDTLQWQPPNDVIMLVLEDTKTKVWKLNEEGKYELTESIGDALIGYAYDGGFCITNEPKPEDIGIIEVTTFK